MGEMIFFSQCISFRFVSFPSSLSLLSLSSSLLTSLLSLAFFSAPLCLLVFASLSWVRPSSCFLTLGSSPPSSSSSSSSYSSSAPRVSSITTSSVSGSVSSFGASPPPALAPSPLHPSSAAKTPLPPRPVLFPRSESFELLLLFTLTSFTYFQKHERANPLEKTFHELPIDQLAVRLPLFDPILL